MNKILFVICSLFFLLNSLTIINAESQLGKIEIVIENLKSNNGVVRMHLYDKSKAEFFPRKTKLAFSRKESKPVNKKARFVIDSLPFGEYAITTHHDENNNRKIDKNFLGLPNEGWGISNNPTVVLSLPDFEEAKVVLNKKAITINIKMNY